MKTKFKLCALIFALICMAIIFMPNQTFAVEVKDVANLAELQAALADENVSEVNLTATIAIEEDVTINGNNKTITTAKAKAFELHTGKFELKNMSIINSAKNGRCIDVRDGDVALTLDNVNLKTTSKSHNQPLTIGSTFSQIVPINIKNTTIEAGPDGWGYAVIIFNPVNLSIENSNITGYTSLYFKSETEGGTGTTGSTLTVNGSTLTGKYELNTDEPSNSFSTIAFNDSGINVDINSSKLYAKGAIQTVIGEYVGMEITEKHNKVTISGNTVISTTQIIAGMKDPDATVILNEGVTSNTKIPEALLPAGAEARFENDVYVVYEPHGVVVNKVENGTITVDKESALEGEKVAINVKANDGYQLKSLKAYTAADSEIEILDGKFVMPNMGAIVVAEFEKIPYAIKIETPTNGKVTASAEKATEGETVTLTVTPETGYELSKLTVNGAEVVDGKFTMPTGGATVIAEFKKIPVVDIVIPEDKTENNNIEIVESEKIKETLDSSLKADTELNKKVEEAKEKGEDVVVEVKVEELEKNNVKEEEKQQILQVVGANQTVHQYFDISVLVTANENELGKITQLTEKMKFSMEISKGLIQENRKFFILKLHGDKVEKIEAKLNGTKLEFETDQFSTFALAYEDKVETSDGVSGEQQPNEEGKDVPPVAEGKDETPKTGMINIPIYVWVSIAVMAVVGILTTKKHSK